jgi:hypothetical protein
VLYNIPPSATALKEAVAPAALLLASIGRTTSLRFFLMMPHPLIGGVENHAARSISPQ